MTTTTAELRAAEQTETTCPQDDIDRLPPPERATLAECAANAPARQSRITTSSVIAGCISSISGTKRTLQITRNRIGLD